MKPLGDRLLLRAPQAPERVGALWLPVSVQADYVLCQAEIVERGEGVQDWRLQPGAHVVVQRFGRTPLDDAGEEFVVRESQVLAIVQLAATEEVI